eukprot:3578743-Rhodomonas_salina.2
MFGGYVRNSLSDAVLTYDLEASTAVLALSAVTVRAEGPAARGYAGVEVEGAGNAVLMFGGVGGKVTWTRLRSRRNNLRRALEVSDPESVGDRRAWTMSGGWTWRRGTGRRSARMILCQNLLGPRPTMDSPPSPSAAPSTWSNMVLPPVSSGAFAVCPRFSPNMG